MARTTMAEIIAEVRRLTNAGTADVVVASVTYWTDDQLQDVIDRHVIEYRREGLTPLSNYINGATTYTDYPLHIQKGDVRIEREGSGGGFAIRTSAGATAPTYTVSWARGMVVFASDTGGDTFYLDCRAFDIYGAVADVFEAKAGLLAGAVDWSSDNHDIKASQEYQHYMERANYYRGMSGGGVVMARRIRTDERY